LKHHPGVEQTLSCHPHYRVWGVESPSEDYLQGAVGSDRSAAGEFVADLILVGLCSCDFHRVPKSIAYLELLVIFICFASDNAVLEMLRVRDKDMLLHVHDHLDPCHKIPKSSRYGDVSTTVSCLYFLKVSIYYSGSFRQSSIVNRGT
jgi:hypothetical protein